jgi:hypothetical protein
MRPQREGGYVGHAADPPLNIETGIIASQKTVSQPFTLRMNTGSPWTDAQID